jgi:hypothetical protein
VTGLPHGLKGRGALFLDYGEMQAAESVSAAAREIDPQALGRRPQKVPQQFQVIQRFAPAPEDEILGKGFRPLETPERRQQFAQR